MKPLTRIAGIAWMIILMTVGICSQLGADTQPPADPAPYVDFPHLIPEINTFSGAATQRVPIVVPPGRHGLQPELAFTYNSYKQNSMIARGWNVHIDAIQRRTKRGVHYDQNEFDLVSDGARIELVPISGMPNYFRARIETDFSQYRFDSAANYWEVTHRDGTKYYFGYYPIDNTYGQARQTYVHGTFAWCLAQVEDRAGNYMTIDYFQDQGQIYPDQINYTGNSNTSLAPANKVVFEYETGTRPDPYISYLTMTAVTTAMRLHAVKAYAYGDAPALEYRLEFDPSPSSQVSLLKKIRIIGSDGIKELPGYTFTYKSGSLGTYGEALPDVSLDINEKSQHFFADMDGDNKDDFVFGGIRTSIGDGTFDDGSCSEGYNVGVGYTTVYRADLNGDGLTDKVLYTYREEYYEPTQPNVLQNHFTVNLNNGDGTFRLTKTVNFSTGINGTPELSFSFFDHNRDGLVDIFTGGKIYYSDLNGDFSTIVDASSIPLGYRADFNADGLTDVVSIANETAYQPLSAIWRIKVRLNNGNGGFAGEIETVLDGFYPENSTSYLNRYRRGELKNTTLYDVNNDNMADMVLVTYDPEHLKYDLQTFISKGNGRFELFSKREISDVSEKTIFADVNGDGQKDLANITYTRLLNAPGDPGYPAYATGSYSIKLSENPAPFDLLDQAVSPSGTELTYTYCRSSETENQHHLPFIVYTVSSIEVDDGVRSTNPQNTFSHELGFYDPSEREFRGFEKVSQIHPDQSITQTFHFVGLPEDYPLPGADLFHPDDNYYYKGRVRQVDKYDQIDGNLLSRTTLTWGRAEAPADPWAFVKLVRKRSEHYDDQTVHSQEDYQYDVDFDGLTGNTAGLLREKQDSGTGADPVVTQYGYTNYSGDPWNPMWRKTLEQVYYQGQQNSPARHTEFIYNSSTGNLEQKIGVNHDPNVADSIWRYQYYSNGNLRYEYDANDNPPTEYVSYDATQTHPTLIRDPAGHETQKAWDTRWGLEDWVTDPNGQTTDYTYDEFGRLSRTDFPDQGYTQLVYSDYCTDAACTNVGLPRQVGVKVRTVGSQTEDTLIYYDGLARKVQTVRNGEDGNYIVSKILYDTMGRIGLAAGPFHNSTNTFLGWADYSSLDNTPDFGLECPYVHTVFDDRGRPETRTSRDGQNGLDQTGYGYSGFETTITDPDGYVKTEIRDHLERIQEVVEDPAGEDIHTHYSYNAAGDLLTVYNAAEPTASLIQIQYDSLGRKVWMDDPDMGQWTYAYFPNGELEQQTDARGHRTRYAYDDINRLENKDYLDTAEPTVTYTYDSSTTFLGAGRLSSISNGDVSTVIKAYDPMGRQAELQKTISGAAPRTMAWDYDYAGRVQRLTYPHTEASPVFYVDYAFHPSTGLLHTATGSDGTVYATMTGYQPSGKIGDLDFGNNVRTTYGYDGWSQRLTSIYTARDLGAGNKHQDRQYTYTKAGDIEQIDDLAWVETYYYSYDNLHRLRSETTSSGSLGVIPGIYEMQYDDPDHIHAASSVTTRGASYNYAYDPNGNMTAGPDLTDTVNVVQRSLTFNADNMPTQVVHPNGGTVNITYDGEAKRAKKSGPNGTTYYFANEFEQIGATETCYIFAGNLRVAMVKDYTAVAYFHKDHLGSSSVITDANGDALEQTRYMPFGGKRGEGAGIRASNYLFTDQELDKESGLYNYDARLYDPVVGRFASADTIVPKWSKSQAFDRYAYTLNNPIKYTDPSGHIVICSALALTALTKAFIVTVEIVAVVAVGLYAKEVIEEVEEQKQLANASKKTKSKDKRAKNRETTDKQKSDNKHTGDSKEAHQEQKNAGSLELTDKEQGIKNSYPEQSAHKTRTNTREKMKKEAQEELEKMRDQSNTDNADQNTDANGQNGGEGGGDSHNETTDDPI